MSAATTAAKKQIEKLAQQPVPAGFVAEVRRDADKARLPLTVYATTDPDAKWDSACMIGLRDPAGRRYRDDGYETRELFTVLPSCWFVNHTGSSLGLGLSAVLTY
jgi:hypothetical protein